MNWFKVWWTDGISEEDAPLLASAYAQARHVRRWVEHQHQGNHLFENLKTLFWAGCTFQGIPRQRNGSAGLPATCYASCTSRS